MQGQGGASGARWLFGCGIYQHVNIWMRVALVAATGALGAVLRYLVGLLVLRVGHDPSLSFIATMIVNAAGAFLFGYCVGASPDSSWLTPAVRLGVLTGFLGGFTTFSAFAGDALQLLATRGYWGAGSYLVAQNLLGVGLCAWGLQLGRLS